MDVGPKLDLLGELFSAVRRNSDLKIGVYYSLFEFFNDLYLRDKESNFTRNDFIQVKNWERIYFCFDQSLIQKLAAKRQLILLEGILDLNHW